MRTNVLCIMCFRYLLDDVSLRNIRITLTFCFDYKVISWFLYVQLYLRVLTIHRKSLYVTYSVL